MFISEIQFSFVFLGLYVAWFQPLIVGGGYVLSKLEKYHF